MFPDRATLYICGIEDGDYKNEKMNFWDNVYGFDMRCIKQMAMFEPLVDIVDPIQVCTDHACVLRVDVTTITKEDLAFEAAFVLQSKRNDFVHALVAYFTCDFTHCHKTISFSTGPGCQYTHWKQTVFYLHDPIIARTGETLTACITVRPNEKNPRDLDISLAIDFDGHSGTLHSKSDYRLR